MGPRGKRKGGSSQLIPIHQFDYHTPSSTALITRHIRARFCQTQFNGQDSTPMQRLKPRTSESRKPFTVFSCSRSNRMKDEMLDGNPSHRTVAEKVRLSDFRGLGTPCKTE